MNYTSCLFKAFEHLESLFLLADRGLRRLPHFREGPFQEGAEVAVKLIAWLTQCEGHWDRGAGGESQALSCHLRASELPVIYWKQGKEEGHPWDQAEVSPEGWAWKWKEAETKRRSGMGWGVAGRRQEAWDSVVTLQVYIFRIRTTEVPSSGFLPFREDHQQKGRLQSIVGVVVLFIYF